MAVLDPNACRAGIATILSGVSGIGQVYRYRRLARTDSEVANLFVLGGKINAWMISFATTQAATSERLRGFYAIGAPGGGEVLTTFTFQIEGYYGVDDAHDSEESFANLAWLIASTFNSYGLINVAELVQQGPCDLVQITYALLANKHLTHYARLQLTMMGRTV